MPDSVSFGGYTFENNEAGYKDFVSKINNGEIHAEDLSGNFFTKENKLDDYLLDKFKDKNLSVITYVDPNDTSKHLIKIIDPSSNSQIDNLNIDLTQSENNQQNDQHTGDNSGVNIQQHTHGTNDEENALRWVLDADNSSDVKILNNNTPEKSEGTFGLYSTASYSEDRAEDSANIMSKILQDNQDVSKNITSSGYSLGNYNNIQVLKNTDFSTLNADDKINLHIDSLPSFGPFTTSIDKHVEAFKELCQNKDFVDHLGEITFDLDYGKGSENKFHPQKATKEFWNKCMEDPELKEILMEHTSQETRDKIENINENERSYWDKVQLGLIIGAIVVVVAIVVIVLLCVMRKKDKNKGLNKKPANGNTNANTNANTTANTTTNTEANVNTNTMTYKSVKIGEPSLSLNKTIKDISSREF